MTKEFKYLKACQRRNINEYPKKVRPIIGYITRYNILINGIHVETNIIGWRTAYAHARQRENPLFEPNKIIEILNLWTGEIITLKEATKRVQKRVNDTVNSATT